ncbi:hypothetical protein PR048_031761 [Dryococelus australis]|uniref:Uncharacterized protein n=1 Tax=Dryococelus australis TaxID=614101 RepID=A0ABQ9G670_9NEOP|nr:hypothetical protein PR048_031761 [Dryococelus australis]
MARTVNVLRNELCSAGKTQATCIKRGAAYRAEKRGRGKGDTATHNKCAIAATRKILSWRAIFLARVAYLVSSNQDFLEIMVEELGNCPIQRFINTAFRHCRRVGAKCARAPSCKINQSSDHLEIFEMVSKTIGCTTFERSLRNRWVARGPNHYPEHLQKSAEAQLFNKESAQKCSAHKIRSDLKNVLLTRATELVSKFSYADTMERDKQMFRASILKERTEIYKGEPLHVPDESVGIRELSTSSGLNVWGYICKDVLDIALAVLSGTRGTCGNLLDIASEPTVCRLRASVQWRVRPTDGKSTLSLTLDVLFAVPTPRRERERESERRCTLGTHSRTLSGNHVVFKHLPPPEKDLEIRSSSQHGVVRSCLLTCSVVLMLQRSLYPLLPISTAAAPRIEDQSSEETLLRFRTPFADRATKSRVWCVCVCVFRLWGSETEGLFSPVRLVFLLRPTSLRSETCHSDATASAWMLVRLSRLCCLAFRSAVTVATRSLRLRSYAYDCGRTPTTAVVRLRLFLRGVKRTTGSKVGLKTFEKINITMKSVPAIYIVTDETIGFSSTVGSGAYFEVVSCLACVRACHLRDESCRGTHAALMEPGCVESPSMALIDRDRDRHKETRTETERNRETGTKTHGRETMMQGQRERGDRQTGRERQIIDIETDYRPDLSAWPCTVFAYFHLGQGRTGQDDEFTFIPSVMQLAGWQHCDHECRSYKPATTEFPLSFYSKVMGIIELAPGDCLALWGMTTSILPSRGNGALAACCLLLGSPWMIDSGSHSVAPLGSCWRYNWLASHALLLAPFPFKKPTPEGSAKIFLGIRTLGVARKLEEILGDCLRHYTSAVQRPAVFGEGYLAECGREVNCKQIGETGMNYTIAAVHGSEGRGNALQCDCNCLSYSRGYKHKEAKKLERKRVMLRVLCAIVGWSCASKVKKRGNDTGDPDTHA